MVIFIVSSVVIGAAVLTHLIVCEENNCNNDLRTIDLSNLIADCERAAKLGAITSEEASKTVFIVKML